MPPARSPRAAAGDREPVGRERHADERHRADPLVRERFSDGDVRPERPTHHEQGPARGRGGDRVDGGARIQQLTEASVVLAFRAHHATEVERQHGEPPVGQVRSDGPQERVVLAAAVQGVGVAQHRSRARRAIRFPELCAQRQAVAGSDQHGLHGRPIASPVCVRGWVNDDRIRSGSHRIVLRDALPWRDVREIVETAEEAGYEAVFVPEIDGREAFSTLTGFAGVTGSMRVGTGVVTVWARTPVVTAMAAGTVNELSGGRMILGIGAGSPAGMGASAAGGPTTPVRLVEEFVRVVREAASGEPVTRGPAGDPFDAEGFRSSLRAGTPPPPIWLAALGDRMMALAGRVADGVLLNWCPPERVASARSVLAEAAEAAGRDRSDVTVAVYVRACLGVEEEHALPPLQAMTGLYASIPHYRRQMEAVGLGDDAEAAARAFAAGRPQDVPVDLVHALTVVGGREERCGGSTRTGGPVPTWCSCIRLRRSTRSPRCSGPCLPARRSPPSKVEPRPNGEVIPS